MDIKEEVKLLQDITAKRLDELTSCFSSYNDTLFQSMNYSVMAGGKRIRPLLMYASAKTLRYDHTKLLDYACALEMIHSYSLIHDDLPAMDDDDFRRGKLTNHKVYGEAIAILAGDGLLSYASSLLMESALKQDSIKNGLKAAKLIIDSAGCNGMLAGQIIDLESEDKQISKETLFQMHRLKTGQLIKAAICTPVILSDNQELFEKYEEIASKIGIAFQIKDDILDVEGDFELLGKRTRQDDKQHKTTYVTLYGLNDAKRILIDLFEEAISLIDSLDGDKKLLHFLTTKIVNRNN